MSQSRILTFEHVIQVTLAPAILLVAFALPPPHDGTLLGLPSLCPFHRLTGLPCPGCGMTRALVCCAHGLWQEAIFYHPLSPLLFMALLGFTLTPVIRTLWPRYALPLTPQIRTGLWTATAYGSALLLLGVWGLRLTGILPGP